MVLCFKTNAEDLRKVGMIDLKMSNKRRISTGKKCNVL